MHDAGLHGRLGPGEPDRLRQPLEAVAADDQRVLEAAVSQLGQHRRPLLGALTARRAEPEAEHVAFAVEVDADRDVDRPVRDLRAADLDHQAVDQQDRVERIERPALPGDHVVDDLVGDLRDRLPRDLGPVDLEQVLLDVAGRQALRVERDHVARRARRGAAGTSAPSPARTCRCRSRGTRSSTSPISVVDRLVVGAVAGVARAAPGRARAARSRDARPSRPRARSAAHAASDRSAGRPHRSTRPRPHAPERRAAPPTPAPNPARRPARARHAPARPARHYVPAVISVLPPAASTQPAAIRPHHLHKVSDRPRGGS